MIRDQRKAMRTLFHLWWKCYHKKDVQRCNFIVYVLERHTSIEVCPVKRVNHLAAV